MGSIKMLLQISQKKIVVRLIINIISSFCIKEFIKKNLNTHKSIVFSSGIQFFFQVFLRKHFWLYFSLKLILK